jgi:actin-related protein
MTEVPIDSTNGEELRRQRAIWAFKLFETFDVPSISFMSTAVLSLFALDRKTGVVVQIGDGKIAFICCIY